MGLAASQARFLAITARKMNCEFQSMQIAQEKLSVTRDQQKAAQDYQNALDATKLVWDTEDNSVYDLTYDLMMTPSALNSWDAYLVTDVLGKVVLTDSMFNAAVKAGIIDEKTGEPTGTNMFNMGAADASGDGSRNAFLKALGQAGQVSQSTINSITKLGPAGYTRSGIGGEVLSKNLANSMTTSAFINYLKEATYETDKPGHKKGDIMTYDADVIDKKSGAVLHKKGEEKKYEADVTAADGTILHKKGDTMTYESDVIGHKKGDPVYSLSNLVDTSKNTFAGLEIIQDSSPSESNAAGKILVTNNGVAMGKEQLSKLTLGDLLSGKYIVTTFDGGEKCGTAATTILSEIAKLLGKDASAGTIEGLNIDSQMSGPALQQAYAFGEVLINPTAGISAGGENYPDSIKSSKDKANDVNGIALGNNNVASVSITNMLKSYLTNFALALGGYDTGFAVEKESASKSKYVTDDYGYYFTIKDSTAITEQDYLLADFYNQLYNQICANGASTDKTIRTQVTDKEYLSHALKNGQLFVSSLNTDGYFYQGNYTLNGHINEEKDEDAIARAEVEYAIKKSKLNTKEQSLELQMKNLDTELSSLTTEYDSVKNLISKNVEKVFTMFST